MLWGAYLLLLVLAVGAAWLPAGWRVVGVLAIVHGVALIAVVGGRGDDRTVLVVLLLGTLLLVAGASALSRRWLGFAGQPVAGGKPSPVAQRVATFLALSLPCAWLAWQGFEVLGRGSDSPLRGHAIALVAAAAALALALLGIALRRRARGAAHWPWIAAPLASLALIGGWSTAQAFAMLRGAEEVAAGKPFCIQLPRTHERYAAARSVGDLSAFVALERGQNHAVLVAGAPGDQRFFHWAHREGRFLPGGSPVLGCRPEPHFASALGLVPGPLAPSPAPDALVAILNGRAFLIREGHRPTTLGSSHSLRFQAALPDFAPGTATTVDLDAFGSCELIEPGVHQGRCLWINEPTAHVQVSPRAAEHGLSSQTVLAGASPSTEWFARDPYGRIAMKITCGPAGLPCSQVFQAAGLTLLFTHGPELVPRWRELQAALLERVAGFEGAGRQELARMQVGR